MTKKEIFDYVSSHAAGTVLSFPERGPWGSSKYRGNFSGWIPASIIFRYGCKSVSEIFAGGGTTSDLCGDLQIPYCGIDLNPNPVRKDILSMDILDEQMELPDAFYQADLQMMHPPYPSINGLHYSNSMWKDTKGVASQDIQEMPWEKGMNAINKAILRGFAAMPNGSYQAIVVGDIRKKVNGKSIFRSMLKDLAMPGETIQILVKMQHNTVSGRNNSYSGNRNFFLLGTHLLVWHHGYQGVNFEVRHQGTYEDCKKAMEKEVQKLKDDLGLHDKDINDNVIDTGDEWEVFDIIKIKA